MKTPEPAAITLVPGPGPSAPFTSLLQRGFLLPCRQAVTIADLLRDLPGLDRSYLESTAQTIFVNSTAVDSIGHILLPGDTVALSGAMPGLAGAIFRRGGRHRCLRSTAHPLPPGPLPDERFVTIKLFNRIAAERGDAILARGIMVRGHVLARFLESRQAHIRTRIRTIRIRDRRADFRELLTLARNRPLLHLRLDRTYHLNPALRK